MSPSTTAPSTFDRGPLFPLATFLLIVAVLSGFALASGGAPSPVLGVVWGVGLAVIAVGALVAEGGSLGTVLPSRQSLAPAIGIVVAFWTLYNVVAAALALADVPGFAATPSRALAHPLPYLAALLSAALFTALPEELAFRAYLQSKFVSLAGGDPRRAATVGITAAALLFAGFHLPRWFIMSGHGIGTDLAVRLFGLLVAGLAYGLVYAWTRNLALVVLAHATMNQPPFLLTVSIPAELHPIAAAVEYGAMVAVVFVASRTTRIGGATAADARRSASSPDR